MVDVSSCCICGCPAAEFYQLLQEDDNGHPCFPGLRMMNRAPGSKVANDGTWSACFLCYRLMIEQWRNYELTNTPENLRQYWAKTFLNDGEDTFGAAAKNRFRLNKCASVAHDDRSKNCAVCMRKTAPNVSKSYDSELLRKFPEISLIIRIGFGVSDGRVTVCNQCSRKPPFSRHLVSEICEKNVEKISQTAGQNACSLLNSQPAPNSRDCIETKTVVGNAAPDSSLLCFICARKFPNIVAKRIQVVQKVVGSVATDDKETESTTPYSFLSNLRRADGSFGPDEDGSIRVCPLCYIGVMQFIAQSIRAGIDLTSNEQQQISLINHINALHRAYENIVQNGNEKTIPYDNPKLVMGQIIENSNDLIKHENDEHSKTETESMIVDGIGRSDGEEMSLAKQKFVEMISSLDYNVYIEDVWRLLTERSNGSAVTFSEDQIAIAANKACEAFVTNLASVLGQDQNR